MKIAYIDPGLSCRKGHNAAMVDEFDRALVIERGHQVSYLCAARTDKSEFADLCGTLEPTFRIEGYAKPGHADLFDAQRFARIADVMATDLAGASVLADCDAILMPTAYPLHLYALAQRAQALRGRRVVLGLLLPASFWGQDAVSERRIGELLVEGINAFAGADLFAYSETGSYRFGDSVVPLATMLPPLATSSFEQIRRLAEEGQCNDARQSPVLGFFGLPFNSKGFGVLVEAVQALVRQRAQPTMRVVIRLPGGYEDACARLNGLAPWLDATSRQTTNDQYLAEMAAVDAVCAFYDPAEYASKMSGIVPEAVSLGKPLLIAEGCTALHDFLERHAPGSFIGGAYEVGTLVRAIDLPAPAWDRPTACARTHAPLMQQMKSMNRYLAVCGLD